jgi:predicted secreted hydrolase
MRRAGLLLLAASLLAGCGGPPILANPPLVFPSPQATPGTPPRQPDPIPVSLPLDDGPHDRLTEWWYYTGHLLTDEGRRFGFEAVVFRAERNAVPTAWASHLAITDEQNRTFHYAQRSEIGPQVDHSPRGPGGASGFDLQVGGLSPALIAAGAPALAPTSWRLAGSNGTDEIRASLTPEEAAAAGAAFGLDLRLEPLRQPVLHDGDGFVDFGPAGSSYYYSRMRLAAVGALELDGETFDVRGIAWFDHQWGDFVSVGGGGWDWFAVNLDDGPDLTVSVVRDASGAAIFEYGTLDEGLGPVGGPARNLDASELDVAPLGSWTSPNTGRTWPSGWRVTIGSNVIRLVPTVQDQELDTRATTGVVYWEGSQDVAGIWDGQPIGGDAYVEITRYDE